MNGLGAHKLTICCLHAVIFTPNELVFQSVRIDNSGNTQSVGMRIIHTYLWHV